MLLDKYIIRICEAIDRVTNKINDFFFAPRCKCKKKKKSEDC